MSTLKEAIDWARAMTKCLAGAPSPEASYYTLLADAAEAHWKTLPKEQWRLRVWPVIGVEPPRTYTYRYADESRARSHAASEIRYGTAMVEITLVPVTDDLNIYPVGGVFSGRTP